MQDPSFNSPMIATDQRTNGCLSATRQPIFIVGHPRSGTTLLRALLGAHHQIHIFNEPDLFVNMRSAGFAIDHVFSVSDRQRLMQHLRSERSSNRYLNSLDENRIEAFLSLKGETSFKDTFEFLLPRPEEKEFWGTKTLHNGYFIRDILNIYPHAIVIPIVRDPRAALLSTYRKRLANSADCIPKFGREGIAFFSYEAMRWAATMDAIERERSLVKAGSIYRERYESIVTHPEAQIRALCDAISIPYDPEMLSETRRRNDPVLHSADAYAHQNLGSSIDASRADRGETLPEWASYIINKCAGETARREGYEFTAKPTLAQRAIIDAGLALHHSKMKKRLANELNRLQGIS